MATIVELFQKQLTLRPDQICVECGKNSFTYQALWNHANQLAYELLGRNLGQNQIIAVYGPTNLDYMVTILGIWLAGHAWVPIDPNLPEKRITHILKETEAPLMIRTIDNIRNIPATIPVIQPQFKNKQRKLPLPNPCDLAYVIYTSGSTGMPKGVCIEHGPLFAHLTGIIDFYNLNSDDITLPFFSPNFDPIVEGIWSTLATGGTVLLRGSMLWTGPQLATRVKKHKVTYLMCPTAYFNAFFGEDLDEQQIDNLSNLRAVSFMGEEANVNVVQKWIEGPLSNIPLYNTYGPTEAVVSATSFRIDADWKVKKRVPIGQCLPGHQILILDSEYQAVDPGIQGELYLGGKSVGCGYLKQPDQTSKRFLSLSGQKGKFYRTGDLVYEDENGDVVYVCRMDNQIKIRGYRIEMDEIKHAILKMNGVRGAVVQAQTNMMGSKVLIAHVVPEKFDEVNSKDLTIKICEELSSLLPAYMIPHKIHVIREFPLTVTGKVDQQGLFSISSSIQHQSQIETCLDKS